MRNLSLMNFTLIGEFSIKNIIGQLYFKLILFFIKYMIISKNSSHWKLLPYPPFAKKFIYIQINSPLAKQSKVYCKRVRESTNMNTYLFIFSL